MGRRDSLRIIPRNDPFGFTWAWQYRLAWDLLRRDAEQALGQPPPNK
ncbi:MAG TPA: hypothetical protein VEL76_10790 [Gemmataceae bacterium]|nr:hypothetical protein [Gemmataceae bacterium]